MSADTGVAWSLRKSTSREVTMPTRREPSVPSSVTGKPLKPSASLRASTAPHCSEGAMHTGAVMKPFS